MLDTEPAARTLSVEAGGQGRNRTTDTRIFSPGPNTSQPIHLIRVSLEELWNILSTYARISACFE
jgi:hypothetical protein